MELEHIQMVLAAPTTGPNGCVSEESGNGLLKRALQKNCRSFFVLRQVVFETLEMEGFRVQVDLPAKDSSSNLGRKSGQPGLKSSVFISQHAADMMKLFEDKRKPGGHAHAFRSSGQVSLWTKAFGNWRIDAAPSNEMSNGPAKLTFFG